MEPIRRLRAERRMTVRQLAEASGVNKDTISALEGGKRKRPHSGTLGKLAAALGVSVDELEAPPEPDRGRELLGRALANLDLLGHYMEHPPDERTWDRALEGYFELRPALLELTLEELEAAAAEGRKPDTELVTSMLRAHKKQLAMQDRIAAFNHSQYGHRHREAG